MDKFKFEFTKFKMECNVNENEMFNVSNVRQDSVAHWHSS